MHANSCTPASYPDIPVLAVSGDFDLRTPPSSARAVVSLFPHGQLLDVANTGHSVLMSSLSSCVARSVSSWLAGQHVTQTCAGPRLIGPLGPFPSVRQRAAQAAKRRAGLRSVAKTVHEAEAAWLLAMSESGWRVTSVAGLTSGRLAGDVQGFTLVRYGVGNGLVLSGNVHVNLSFDRPLAFEGTLRVSDQGTTHTETVYLAGNRIIKAPDQQAGRALTTTQFRSGARRAGAGAGLSKTRLPPTIS